MTKRETLVQNITYMAIMAAINAIFSLLAALVPALSLFLMIVLPLSSAVVFLFCKHKYYPIYAIATIIICLLITIFDMSFTIFYVIPSIITGYIFGLFIKYKLHAVWIILITSIAQGLFTALTLPLINVIFDVNIIDTFKGILQLTSSTNVDIIVPSFLFYLALTQMIFSYIVIHSEIHKFGYKINDHPINTTIFSYILLGTTIMIIPFIFLLPSGAYLLLSVSLYFMFFIAFTFIMQKSYKVLIAYGGSLLAFMFLFALLYPIISSPFGLLLTGLLPVLIALISLANNLLFNRQAKDKMISTGKE
ncbi:MAG: hypothetical protein WC215_00805 [Bacilli bacterium]